MSTHTPRKSAPAKDPAQQLWQQVQAMFDTEGQAPPRVLVAEPRAELRLQIGHALRQAGMDADFAIDGAEAQMKVLNGHYDVAILNPDMESPSSHSLCRILSRGTGRERIPVITLCDRDSSMRRIRSLISGAQACLVRPLSSDDFVSTVWQMAHGD